MVVSRNLTYANIKSGYNLTNIVSKSGFSLTITLLHKPKNRPQFAQRVVYPSQSRSVNLVSSTILPGPCPNISLLNEEMVYMNNLEMAPHNYRRSGKHERFAGNSLINNHLNIALSNWIR